MIVVSRFRDAGEDFADQVRPVLALLAGRPGFLRARLGRAADDPGLWALVTEWRDVGSFRRAMSAHDLRPVVWPLLGRSLPEAGAFEVLLSVDAPAA